MNCATTRDPGIKWDAELHHVKCAVIVGKLDIEWDAKLHPRHMEGSLMTGEPEANSYADAPTVVNMADLSSSNSSTCCILRYFKLRNRHKNGNGKGC